MIYKCEKIIEVNLCDAIVPFFLSLTRLIQGGGPAPDPTPGGAKPKSQ